MDITALQGMDFVVIADASGSTDKTDCKGGRSRYKFQQESLVQFARDLEKIDSDGVDLVLMNRSEVETFAGSTADKLETLFNQRGPRGGTPTAEALTAAFALKKPGRRLFVLVSTDGVPDDKAAVEAVITKQANSQAADDECTVLFVQVGNDARSPRVAAEARRQPEHEVRHRGHQDRWKRQRSSPRRRT
jgi:Mg-chelatase subunit ChlD